MKGMYRYEVMPTSAENGLISEETVNCCAGFFLANQSFFRREKPDPVMSSFHFPSSIARNFNAVTICVSLWNDLLEHWFPYLFTINAELPKMSPLCPLQIVKIIITIPYRYLSGVLLTSVVWSHTTFHGLLASRNLAFAAFQWLIPRLHIQCCSKGQPEQESLLCNNCPVVTLLTLLISVWLLLSATCPNRCLSLDCTTDPEYFWPSPASGFYYWLLTCWTSVHTWLFQEPPDTPLFISFWHFSYCVASDYSIVY